MIKYNLILCFAVRHGTWSPGRTAGMVVFLTFSESHRSRGHAFYDRRQQILWSFLCDTFVGKLCPHTLPENPPGRSVRRRCVGPPEGIARKENLARREFLQCAPHVSVPGRSSFVGSGSFGEKRFTRPAPNRRWWRTARLIRPETTAHVSGGVSGTESAHDNKLES